METPVLPPSATGVFAANRNDACTACPLHLSVLSNRCVPTRPADFCQPSSDHTKALLVIGEGPGFDEDLAGKCFIGPTGALTHALLGPEGFRLNEVADVYLANVSRCRPPKDASPTQGNCRTCSKLFLFRDLNTLQQHYEEVVVLLMGAKAIGALLRVKFKEAVGHQGRRVRFPFTEAMACSPVPVFSTYHFAYLLPGRNPSASRAVSDHLNMVRDYLTGTLAYPSDAPKPEAALLRSDFPFRIPTLSLDIETYGALAGKKQTVFDPHRSVVVDRCQPSDLIQTVALSFHDPVREKMRTTVFVWSNPEHRRRLEDWLARQAADKGILLGMNLCFDLSYLRFCSLFLSHVLSPSGGLILRDLSITNYLHNEQRPERSLKAIAPLVRAGNYDDDHPLPEFDAADAYDPRLWEYNGLDAYRTYVADQLLRQAIAKDFGPDTRKLSPWADVFYSNVLWTLLHMSEAGMPFSLPRLSALHAKMEQRMARVSRLFTGRWGLALSGPGSDKPLRQLFVDSTNVALSTLTGQSLTEFRRNLQMTEKTKTVSTGKDNMALLLGVLPKGKERRMLTQLERARKAGKMISSYTKPLQTNPAKGLTNGVAYATWYPCPSRSQDTDDREGGTMQGRVCAQRPGLQTAPSPVKKCYTTRFKGGELWSFDESQLELRIAALCSGDPLMLEDYIAGGTGDHDRHTRTGRLVQDLLYKSGLLPRLVAPDHPDFKPIRQVGKRANFLTLYRGGPFRLSWSVRADIGWNLPESASALVIDGFYAKHVIFHDWQESLIWLAKKQGYIELVTGRSRSFIGSEQTIDETYVNEICNFPVQSLAADLLLDAQRMIREGFASQHLRSVMPAQTYDQVFIDIYPGEKEAVFQLVESALTRPALLGLLEDTYGHTCPLAYDAKRYA